MCGVEQRRESETNLEDLLDILVIKYADDKVQY